MYLFPILSGLFRPLPPDDLVFSHRFIELLTSFARYTVYIWYLLNTVWEALKLLLSFLRGTLWQSPLIAAGQGFQQLPNEDSNAGSSSCHTSCYRVPNNLLLLLNHLCRCVYGGGGRVICYSRVSHKLPTGSLVYIMYLFYIVQDKYYNSFYEFWYNLHRPTV